MKIVTLQNPPRELPLLPPGVSGIEVNRPDPGINLMEKFNRWLADRNYGLLDMSNLEIYKRLYKLGGKSHNPLTCEQAYQTLLELREVQQESNEEPLLPPGI